MADIGELKGARPTEDYLPQQVQAMKTAAYWTDHKRRIGVYDTLYAGTFASPTPGDDKTTAVEEPYVENKLKNSTHDIKRLAREARGYPVFTKEGEDDKSATRAKVRAAIADTIWEEGGGADSEGQLYLDLIAGGFAAVGCYIDKDDCEYPLAMRLNPRFAYPTVANGKLVDMLYIETMKERSAAILFPALGLSRDPKNNDNVDVVLHFDADKVRQAVIVTKGKSTKGYEVSTWEHALGKVPVAFKALETADGHYRGLLDQLGGPLKARNKAVRLMLEYLEDMVAAPYEEKGIENSNVLPGPDVVYHHERDAEGETFIRRVAPSAPAGSVWGLLNYLDSQESSEGFQPPSRVGQVKQSIASGSFVASTQGSLSSVVLEMQGYVSQIRRDYNKIAMRVDEKHLNKTKPLIRAVGQQNTYKPKTDIAGWFYHKVAFGAAAGLDRQTADSRVLQHLGAGLIDENIARDQIDYVENDTNVQDDVDRMMLRKVMFQKLIQDPNVPFSALAAIEQEMAKGKTRTEALEAVLPEMLAREKAATEAAVEGAGGAQMGQQAPGAEDMGLSTAPAGGVPQQAGAQAAELSDFAPPPITQIIAGQ